MEATIRQRDAAKRLRPVFIGATALLVALLGVFAYALAKSQQQQRRDVAHRFDDRAVVAAAVNESIFTLATNQTIATDSAQFGGPKVPKQLLARRVAANQAPYALILDAQNRVLAQVGNVAQGTGRSALIAKTLKSHRAEYSSVLKGPGGRPIVEAATAFPTKFGPRIDVTSVDATLLSKFLGGFLVKLPTVAHARSYVIDSEAKLIAAPGQKKIAAGVPLADHDLATAASKKMHGDYDGNRYFASAPIAGTPWRIVLSASRGDLYASVKTTVPWLIFGAFVLMSAAGLFLVRRVLLANAELQRADLSRRHALEINDNVVQRLVLAKYALDRGATETSQQKLAETLRETQQLVTSLLEEKEIVPGALRRDKPASAEGPPEPPSTSWPSSR
jgi:hypothetical protein